MDKRSQLKPMYMLLDKMGQSFAHSHGMPRVSDSCWYCQDYRHIFICLASTALLERSCNGNLQSSSNSSIVLSWKIFPPYQMWPPSWCWPLAMMSLCHQWWSWLNSLRCSFKILTNIWLLTHAVMGPMPMEQMIYIWLSWHCCRYLQRGRCWMRKQYPCRICFWTNVPWLLAIVNDGAGNFSILLICLW